MAMVPSLVASTVGGGWRPDTGKSTLSDPAAEDPSKSTAALFNGGFQVHPESDLVGDTFLRQFSFKETGHTRTMSGPSSRHSRNPSVASKAPSMPGSPVPSIAEVDTESQSSPGRAFPKMPSFRGSTPPAPERSFLHSTNSSSLD